MSNKALYEVKTFNDSVSSENRMHSDDIAQKYGFQAALVPGVTVFGHMCYLPLQDEGEKWLTNNRAEVRFISPAYDGDVLTIEYEPNDSKGRVTCVNAASETLATMSHEHEAAFGTHAALAIAPSTKARTREEIHWDNIETEVAAPAHFFEVDEATNARLANQINDDLTLYYGDRGVMHPFWMLRECNAAFVRSFVLPAWIHVGSKMTFHSPIRCGDQVEVRMVPLEKWERKGHQFTTLYIPFLVDGEARIEVEHTSIFRIAERSENETE